MTSLLIALHVLAAILFLGPVTVAVSSYQVHMLKAAGGDDRALGSAQTLHRITNSYGYLSAIVPIVGLAIFLTDLDTYARAGQFHASILLAVIAWVVLLVMIIPRQRKTLNALENRAVNATAADTAAVDTAAVDFEKEKKQLSMFGGIFSLLWVITAILMFI